MAFWIRPVKSGWDDNKIIVTLFQKLNNLMKAEATCLYTISEVVFIFDECCHRSQFGEAQKNLKKKFKRYYQFVVLPVPYFSGKRFGLRNDCQRRIWP